MSLVDDKAMVEDLGSTNGTFVDGERITTPSMLEEGKVLRIGSQRFRYERRSRREVERAEDLERDLANASSYVLSLLPEPLTAGPVRTDWRFVPSAQLGGDAFGYYWLDPETFVFYLFDVAGHGVGSAMHSATVMNVLRQRALPHVDFSDPASVLSSLNVRFQMDGHSGLFFTMWYGVYRPGDRTLVCGSAGHHPAYLVPSDRTPRSRWDGRLDDGRDRRHRLPGPADDRAGRERAVPLQRRRVRDRDERPAAVDAVGLPAAAPAAGVARDGDAERIYRAVRQAAGPGPLDDDFSLMAVTFLYARHIAFALWHAVCDRVPEAELKSMSEKRIRVAAGGSDAACLARCRRTRFWRRWRARRDDDGPFPELRRRRTRSAGTLPEARFSDSCARLARATTQPPCST